MRSVHDQLRSVERRLAQKGATRLFDDDDIDSLDDAQADVNLRGETDRLAQLVRLEAEQNRMPARRDGGTGERQGRLF